MAIAETSTGLGHKRPWKQFWQMLFFKEDKDVTLSMDEQVWKRTRIYMFATSSLVALWGVFDVFIDFENLWFFLALRAIYTPITLLWALNFHLPIFRDRHKKWALVHYILLIIDIGIMVLWTDEFVKYLIGFSTIYWGASVIMLWRFWYTVIPGLVVILIATLRFYYFPHDVAEGEFVTGLYYFATCLVFTTIISAYGYYNAYQLAAQNLTLEKTSQQLIQAEKMSSMNMLVAGVAHEINTPVGTAITAVTHTKDEINKILDELKVGEVSLDRLTTPANDGLASLNSTIVELERTARLVDRFKQTAIDQSTDTQRLFNLTTYLKQNIIEVGLRPMLKDRNIIVEVMGERELMINSFPGEFSQVFTNLIHNSIEHGYTREQLAHQPGMISINLKQNRNQTLTIHYKDDGVGMNEQQLASVFEPFYTTRGDGDSDHEEGRAHKGTGLGMSIVYNIITQKLGGQITAHSQPGKGAEFIIELPVIT